MYLAGIPDAARIHVTCTRTRLSTTALLVAVLLTTGAPLFAAAGSHQTCDAEPDCDQTVRISACCCCDDSDTSNQPAISQPRLEPAADPQPAVAGVAAPMDLPLCVTSWQIGTYPPRRPPPDLPILFADLRL